jgi:hypothetical protein
MSGVGDLEALVLENTLDGGIFAAGRQLGLENDTEGTVADNLALGVLHLFRLSGQTILDLFANYLCTALARAKSRDGPMDGKEGMASCMADAQMAQGEEMKSAGEVMVSLPPMRKLENAEGLFCDMIANDREVEEGLKRGRRGVAVGGS